MNPVDAALDHICGKRSVGDYYISIERVLAHGCRQGTIWVSECPGGAYQSIGNFKISDDFSLVFNLKSFQGIFEHRHDFSRVFSFNLYDDKFFENIDGLLGSEVPKYIDAFRDAHNKHWKRHIDSYS